MAYSEAEQKFLDFDWSASTAWLAYFDGLFPEPPHEKVLKFKKKWYCREIDPEFDVDTTLGEKEHSATAPPPKAQPKAHPTPQPSAAAGSTSSSPPAAAAATAGGGGRQVSRNSLGQDNVLSQNLCAALRVAALVLTAIHALPFGYKNFFRTAAYTHAAANVVAIVVQFGMPQFTIEWLQRAAASESALAGFFSLVALVMPEVWLPLASPSITAALGLAEAYDAILKPLVPPTVAERLKLPNAAAWVNMKRYDGKKLRANAQILTGCLAVLFVFLRKVSIFGMLMYWNNLRSAYQLDQMTRTTFAKMHSAISGFLAKPQVPAVLPSLYHKAANAMYNFAAPQPRQA